MFSLPDIRRKSGERHVNVLILLTDALVLTVYVWLISVGTWIHWPTHGFAYDALASAFRRGQLALEAAPDPALLALPDPYDPVARQDVTFIRDYSLYDGHYYLYFGPVPALILVLVKSLISGQIGDEYITFVFVAGIFVLMSLLIRSIRTRLFPDSSSWTVAPAVLTAGLMVPWTWFLTAPSKYTASIGAGQFFFLAGFFAAFSAFRHAALSRRKLFLAAVLWAAALGARISLILPIAFMTISILIGICLQYRQASGRAQPFLVAALSLIVPLVAALAGLAWYNWARFGSILEAGFMYQMGGVFKWKHIGEFVWPGYSIQNFYNYWLNPPGVKYPFPYLFPKRGIVEPLLASLPIPGIYHAQEITGLVYSAPFLVLALLPIFTILRQPFPKDDSARLFRWLVIALLGSFLFGCAFFLSFFWAAERYLADFLPGLVLLSIIGMWQLDRYLTFTARGSTAYWTALLAVMATSILVSILLSMSFNTDGFRRLNPLLWRQLSNLFRP